MKKILDEAMVHSRDKYFVKCCECGAVCSAETSGRVVKITAETGWGRKGINAFCPPCWNWQEKREKAEAEREARRD